MEYEMRSFVKLAAALCAALSLLLMGHSPADAHRWHRHCHHHHHHHWASHCHCHWRHYHHRHHHWHHHHHHHYYGSSDGIYDGGSDAVPSSCKGRIDGVATGQGVFGLGSARARQAAISDWEQKATSLFGAGYGSFSRARGVRWDCSKLAIIRAKCVVTAMPCQ
jgi:hypothetical protein